MKILVTGSRGFIGSELMKRITADGIDLKNGTDVCQGIRGKYDIIVHLAALMNGESNLYDNNISSTFVVTDYCKQHKTRLIFTSSAAVYGDADIFPTPESVQLNPINDYGISKVKCERMVGEVKDSVILRLSNVALKPDSAWGKFNTGTTTIYGDGRQVRDYVAVSQVIDSILKCITTPLTGIYNISSGIGITTNRLFSLLSDKKPEYIESPYPEIKTSILDNTKWRSL